MLPSEFFEYFPRLFHVPATATNALRHGLLSTTRILQLLAEEGYVEWRWNGDTRWHTSEWRELNRRHRTDAMFVRKPNDPSQVFCLRDQRPLGNLVAFQQHCLTDLSGAEWIEILNDRVYLFPSQPRQNQICEAGDGFRAKYLSKVAVFKTESLSASLVERIELSFLNGGAINGIAKRSGNSYQPLRSVDQGALSRVQEITVRGGLSKSDLVLCCISPWLCNLLNAEEDRAAGSGG